MDEQFSDSLLIYMLAEIVNQKNWVVGQKSIGIEVSIFVSRSDQVEICVQWPSI